MRTATGLRGAPKGMLSAIGTGLARFAHERMMSNVI